MYCPKCKTEIANDAHFCSSCGYLVTNSGHEEAASTNATPPQEQHSSSTPPSFNKRRGRKGWIIGATTAVIIIAGGIGFTVLAKPFASGKQLLVNSINDSSLTSTGQTPVQEKVTLQLKNIQAPSLSGAQAAMLSTLNGSTIDMNILLQPKAKQAQIKFDSQYQSVKHSGALWVNSDKAVLSISEYQSLLAPVLNGVTFPKYLVTDATQAQAVQSFWSNLESPSTKLTQSQQQAVVSLGKILLNAIPGKYIHRSSLNSVSISFNQSGLEDILKSEVKAVYANKEQVATSISAFSQSSGASSATIKQSVLNGLNQTPEESLLASITTAFNSGVISVKDTSFTITKKMLGKGLSESFTGGISVNEPTLSLTVNYNVDAQSPTTQKVQMPSTDSSNSQTFSQWATASQTASTGS